jgi:hypothetical protein
MILAGNRSLEKKESVIENVLKSTALFVVDLSFGFESFLKRV